MKKLAFIVTLLGILGIMVTGLCAEENEKASVALVFVNNGKTTYDDELGQKLMDNVNTKLVNYKVVSGAFAIERLNKIGVTDISAAERSDIVNAFKDVDYVLCLEIQPVISKQWITFFSQGTTSTVTVPLKIIDVANNKYLYNGKFTEQADNRAVLIGGVGTKAGALKAVDQINVKLGEVVTSRLPLKGISKQVE